MSRFRLAYRLNAVDFILRLFFYYYQLKGKSAVELRIKEVKKKFLLIVGLCPQQFHKLSLGDHSNLHKLMFIQSDDFFQLPVRFFLRIFCPVRQSQRDRLAFLLNAGAPF